MITEDYVSFEIAKMLKEKGFDKAVLITDWWYDAKGRMHKRGNYSYSGAPVYDKETCFNCPTLQMAMKWLREVHEIFIRPNTIFLYPIRYYCEIFCYGDNLKTQQDVTTENFESPEEACEAAIKYCLENLI